MTFKHLGGALSPGQEFVCFRCRVGWSGSYTRLTRRNVQTESESRSSPVEALLGLILRPPRDGKSTSEATIPNQSTNNSIVRRIPSLKDALHKTPSALARKKRHVRSQVAKDALLLDQKFRNARKVSNASSAFRNSAVRLESSPRRVKPLVKNRKNLARESSSTLEVAHQVKNELEKVLQDKDQQGIATKKQKTRSSTSQSKIKAGKDAGKTETKTIETEEKDSSFNKTTVGTKIMEKNLRNTKVKKTARAAKKQEEEKSARLSPDDALTHELLKAVALAKIPTAGANRKPRRRGLKATEILPELKEKMTQIDEGRIATSLASKSLSSRHARDKSQNILTAKAPQKKGNIKKSPTVQKRRLQRVGRSPKLHPDLLEALKLNIKTVKAEELHLAPLEIEQAPVPALSYGLDRVLFNPGVYHLQDQRSRVFNFDPYLQTIMPVAEFDFDALKAYITSSKDQALKTIAEKHGKRYRGSSSSMTAVLGHFHFLLSQFRAVNFRMLSKGFPDKGLNTFTSWQRIPAAIFLMKKDGSYAIDADKEFDIGTILSHLGKSMEKLLTLNTKDYERYRKSNPEKVPTAEMEAPESFHYSTVGDLLMRSQLDAHDHRLPGSGMFDLKTRAVVSIRMDAHNHHNGLGYEIKTPQGEWESYEREYYDMIRSAFLKYSLQVRMGRMDGIFVAFHNVQRIFGFQYITLAEMDVALHGQASTIIGDEEFKLSLGLLNQILDRATEKYPDSSLRIHFEAREGSSTYMYIFAEPMTEDQVEEIQSSDRAKTREIEQALLGNLTDEPPSKPGQEERCNDWAKIEASVKEAMHSDEMSLINDTPGNGLSTQPVDSYDGKTPDGTVEDNEHVESSTDGQNPAAALDDNAPIEDADNSHDLSATSDGLLSEENVQESDNSHDLSATGNELPSEENVQEPDDSHELSATSSELLSEENAQEPDSHDLSTAGGGILSEEEENAQESDNNHDLHTTGDGLLSVDNSPEPNDAAENDFDVSGDAEFLDSTDKAISATAHIKVCAWVLSIRNKVNGQYIDRPDRLTPSDKWEVDYSLTEVTDPAHAQILYQACQLRRREQVENSREHKDTKFFGILRNLSKLGADWRQKLDKAEKGKPIITFTSAMAAQNQQEKNISKRMNHQEGNTGEGED